MQGYRALIFAAVVVALLAGCETTRKAGSPAEQNLTAQAERMLREHQYANAAHIYEDLAQNASPESRDPFLLRAARSWLRAEDLPRGESLLRQIGNGLPASDANLQRLATAEAALLNRRPERALVELDRIPQPYPRELAPDVLEVRARAQFAYGRPTGGVTTALDRERLLTDTEEIARNRKMIWDGIQLSAAAGVDMQVPSGASRAVAGWLELGRAAVALARNPYTAQTAMNDWRTKYPEHAANEFITQTVIPQIRAETAYPTDIALILPLSGRGQANGVAVRDGFVAAFLQQPVDRRPTLRIYDSAAGVSKAHARAVADGAKFIVGPLLKPEVAELFNAQPIATPTLVLNQSPEHAAAIANLFEFWPDPAHEARQVAARAAAENHLHGIAILPNDEWGQRVYRAFDEELRARGGELVANRFYDPASFDFSKPVADSLLVTESQARLTALQQAVGTKLQFEPRVRGDIEFVFIAAREPEKGRLLRPALRSHLSADMPVYATSDIFEPAATTNAELNGVVFPDMPWIIASDEESNKLRATLQKIWPRSRSRDGRLYAFGFDAYRLIPRLQSTDLNSTLVTAGMSGRLMLDDTGRIRRDLDWGRIVGGKLEAVGPIVVNTATTDKP
jgi:outer membrane PBP1 activator LpoA protein